MRYNRIFLLLVLSCSLFCASCRAPLASGEALLTPADERKPTDGSNAVAQAQQTTKDDTKDGEESAKQFLSSLTFLGDSTTAHMRQRAPIADTTRVWATKTRYLNLDSKICTAKIEDPAGEGEILIAQAAARYRPAYLMITLGIDYGVYYYRDAPEKFRLCYEKLLDAIQTASPDTRIILGAIFPVAECSPVITNEMVDHANETIREIAKARALPYADNNTVLKNEAGFLKEEYCYSEDGIHLTAAAYEAIFRNLEALSPTLR